MAHTTMSPVSTIRLWQDAVINHLFEHEDRRLAGLITQVAKDNDELSKSRGQGAYHGFIFDGVAYREQTPPVHYAALPGLDVSLNDRMELVLSQKATIDREMQLVRQCIFNLLDAAENEQQIRDTLPECLFPVMKNLLSPVPDRMASPGCTISHLPRAQKQFEKTLPIIEQYAATKLIFS